MEEEDTEYVAMAFMTLFNRLSNVLRAKNIIDHDQSDIDQIFELGPGMKGQVADIIALMKDMEEQRARRNPRSP
jgi:hypothetical protein